MGIKSSNPPDKGERSYRKRKSSAGGIRKQAPQKVGKISIPKKDMASRRAIEFHPSEIQARQVYLLGDFNSWEPGSFPLKRNLSGQWEGVFPLAPGRYEFKLFADGAWIESGSCDVRMEGPDFTISLATESVINSFGTQNLAVTVR